MSETLKHESKIFSASEFAATWGLWLSKGHDPASKLRTFTVTTEGVEMVNVGILDYGSLESVVFPSEKHACYEAAFSAIGSALDDFAKGGPVTDPELKLKAIIEQLHSNNIYGRSTSQKVIDGAVALLVTTFKSGGVELQTFAGLIKQLAEYESMAKNQGLLAE